MDYQNKLLIEIKFDFENSNYYERNNLKIKIKLTWYKNTRLKCN